MDAPGGGRPTARLGARAMLLLVVLAAVPRLIVAWELPLAASATAPECAPDEGLQYWTVMHYADGDLATWPASGSIYSAYPPVPYALHAATLAAARLVPGDGPARFPSSWWRLRRFTAARLGSVLLGVVTVLSAAAVAAAWTGSAALTVASGAAVAFQPQLVFVGGYVNADAFSIAAAMALAAALSRWATGGEGARGVVAVGLAAGAVLVGKPTGYAVLMPTALWLVAAWRHRRIDAGALLRAAGAAAAIALPVLTANALRNDGDPLGLGKYGELLATAYQGRPGVGAPVTFLRDLARSSFGVFRHADLWLPLPYYLVAAAFLALGLGRGAVLLPRAGGPRRGALGWLAASLAINLGLVVWNGWAVDRQPQGRYLLPTVAPLWVAVTCALGATTRWLVLGWLALLATSTVAAVVLIHAHPCL